MLNFFRSQLVKWRNWLHLNRLKNKVINTQWANHLAVLSIPTDDVASRSENIIYFSRIDLELKIHPTVLEILEYYSQLVALVEKCGAKLTWDTKVDELMVLIGKEKYPVHNGEEVYILYEIFVRADYNLKIPDNSLLFDIGANVGFTSLFLASRNPGLSIIAYEPLEENYLRASHNFNLNSHLKNEITLHNFGLSRVSAEVEIQSVVDNPGRSSIVIDRSTDTTHTIKRHNISVQNAGLVIEQSIRENTSKSFWIKMDCEGSEYDIVNSLAEAGALEKIKCFILEWHVVSDERKERDELNELLCNHGFSIHMRSEFDRSAIDGMCIAFR